MKRKILLTFVTLIVVLSLGLFCLIGCTPEEYKEKGEDIKINVCVPDGSPAISIAKLIAENPKFDGYTINYEVVSGSVGIGARLSNDQATIAIAPTNAGATQFNKRGSYKLIATSTQGSLYMVGKQELGGSTTVEKLNALKGKTLYNIGMGQTPDLTFKFVLDYYQIPYQVTDVESADYVALQYVTEGTELIGLLKAGKAEYGILGEPAVTNANSKTGTSTIFSLTDLWNEVNGTNSGFPQASVFINKSIANGEHDEFISWFLGKLTESANWVNENAAAASTALTQAGSISLNNLTNEMVQKCNIEIVKASSAKNSVNAYLSALHGFNPATIGGSIPNDDFYYNV